MVRVAANCVELLLIEQNLAVSKPMTEWNLPVLAPSPERLATHACVAKYFIYREIQTIVEFDRHVVCNVTIRDVTT